MIWHERGTSDLFLNWNVSTSFQISNFPRIFSQPSVYANFSIGSFRNSVEVGRGLRLSSETWGGKWCCFWVSRPGSDGLTRFLGAGSALNHFEDFPKLPELEGYLFLERREGREKERERNIDVQQKHQSVASCVPPTGDLACNPGMCPDWESNRRPFSLQDVAKTTEPQVHQSGHEAIS